MAAAVSAAAPTAPAGGAPVALPAKILGMPREGFISLMVCVFYGMTSGSMALLNKALLSAYNFNGYFLLLAAQMGLQLLLCVVSREFFGNPFGVPQYDRAVHMSSLRMGVVGVANVAVGFVGLQMVNVPMFLCIRRLVAPCILIYEWLTMGKVAEGAVQAAVSAIMLGTLIAGWDSLNADYVGYMLTMGNNLLSAATSVMQKQFSVHSRLNALGTLYYNSMTALPLAALCSVLFGETAALRSFHYVRDPAFWMNFAISASMGPLITYSSILCTTHNSPLATSITGNVKDLVITVMGAFMFPGFKATLTSVGGLAVSFVGAGLYSYVNLRKALGGAPAHGPAAGSAVVGGGAAMAAGDGGASAPSPKAMADGEAGEAAGSADPEAGRTGAPAASLQSAGEPAEEGSADEDDESARLLGVRQATRRSNSGTTTPLTPGQPMAAGAAAAAAGPAGSPAAAAQGGASDGVAAGTDGVAGGAAGSSSDGVVATIGNLPGRSLKQARDKLN